MPKEGDRLKAQKLMKDFDPRLYRPLAVTVSLTMHEIHAHLMKTCSESDPTVPTLYMERLSFEMDKKYLGNSFAAFTIAGHNVVERPIDHQNRGQAPERRISSHVHPPVQGTRHVLPNWAGLLNPRH